MPNYQNTAIQTAFKHKKTVKNSNSLTARGRNDSLWWTIYLLFFLIICSYFLFSNRKRSILLKYSLLLRVKIKIYCKCYFLIYSCHKFEAHVHKRLTTPISSNSSHNFHHCSAIFSAVYYSQML